MELFLQLNEFKGIHEAPPVPQKLVEGLSKRSLNLTFPTFTQPPPLLHEPKMSRHPEVLWAQRSSETDETKVGYYQTVLGA
jgi:hypothetical protein